MAQQLEKTLRQRALEYLAKREYSYYELRQKLQGFAEADEDLDALLGEFKTRGWLSDERFAEQTLHARRTKFGSAKIAHELREKGVEEHLVADAVAKAKENELENAQQVWRKKFGSAPANRDEWAKQARFLQGRGFNYETIKHILNSREENPE